MDSRVLDGFERSGFVVLRQAVPKELQRNVLETMRSMIVAQVHRAGRANDVPTPPSDLEKFFDAYVLAVEKLDHKIIFRVYETCFDTVAARSIFNCANILEPSAAALNTCAPRLFLNSNRIRIDPPGPAPYRLGWHQESGYTRNKATEVQFWAPLMWPSSWENGSVEVAVGSHAAGHVSDDLDATIAKEGGKKIGATQNLVRDELVSKFETKLVEIEPGDVLLFSCDLFHRSSDPSRQTRMKYSVTGRFTDAGSEIFSPYEGLPNG